MTRSTAKKISKEQGIPTKKIRRGLKKGNMAYKRVKKQRQRERRR
jgi:hypothetical protein